VRPGELLVQVVLKPLLGVVMLALRTVAGSTGVRAAVVLATPLAWIETMSVMCTLALWDGMDELAVCEGQLRRALQVFRGKGGADGTPGGQGRQEVGWQLLCGE
jgi:hypothetical protein